MGSKRVPQVKGILSVLQRFYDAPTGLMRVFTRL